MTIEEKKNNMISSSSKKEDENMNQHHLVHSQVKKIKQESEKDGVEWSPWQPEMRGGVVVREMFTRQQSRSRLVLINVASWIEVLHVNIVFKQ